MNVVGKCRLCWVSQSQGGHSLYDGNGDCTKVYEVTVKYFDPMLLIVDSSDGFINQSTVICRECWGHIKDFHEFQQNILASQCRLMSDIKPILEEVKEETNNICNHFDMEEKSCNIDGKQDSRHNSGNMSKAEIVNVAAARSSPNDLSSELTLENVAPLILEDVKEESSNSSHIKEDDDYLETKHDSEDDDGNLSNPATGTPPRRNRRRRKGLFQNDSLKPKARERKLKPKSILNEAGNSSKDAAHNSAEKIQELDNFIADVRPELECDLCKLNFPNYNSLRSHFSEEHQTKCFVVCCDRRIFRRYLLVEHLRLHVNPETFKCDVCGAISSSSRTLIAHKRFMHNTAKTLECEICHRKFKGKPTLIRHMATHVTGSKDFKCSQCDRCFAFEFQLKNHINNVHSETKICDQCGKTLHGAAALKQHLLQHSDTKQPKWPCDQCDAQLASLRGLKSHKLSFHPDGTTAFICKDCGKVASSETTLLRHKRLVHEMERKYKCTYCEKAFKKNSHLKDHIATHTGQHLHQCPHCSQTFINSGSVHKHRKRAHPVEWAESRQNRVELPKVNADSVVREVLL